MKFVSFLQLPTRTHTVTRLWDCAVKPYISQRFMMELCSFYTQNINQVVSDCHKNNQQIDLSFHMRLFFTQLTLFVERSYACLMGQYGRYCSMFMARVGHRIQALITMKYSCFFVIYFSLIMVPYTARCGQKNTAH